jgi:retron-type reverse transcriptase
MKSYNHLFEKYLSKENIEIAIHNASKGKRDRPAVVYYREGDPDEITAKVQSFASEYHNATHSPVEIYDGITRKKRTIIVPKFYEQIVHHMAVNILIPIFSRGMYEHSYASIPGRGAHRGKNVIEKWIRHDPKHVKYCLKTDVRKFFDSIPHDVLLSKLEKLIHDEKFLGVLREIIGVTDHGLPLGFYTSQWLANWYLQELDHFIKEQLRAPHYIRYMDDMVVFGSNKRDLHRIRAAIADFLKTRLGLELKGNWQVFRFDYVDREGRHHGRDLDYMGFRFYRDRTTIRRSIMLKATRKARRIAKKGRATVYDLRQILSYLGWIDATNTYGMYTRWIKPFVNFQVCKRRISAHDKRKQEGKTKCSGNRHRARSGPSRSTRPPRRSTTTPAGTSRKKSSKAPTAL